MPKTARPSAAAGRWPLSSRPVVAVLLLAVALAAGLIPVLSRGPASLAAEPAGPRVVVSIKPLHSLVAGVMDGLGAPLLLIEGAASPHSASLRPSDARALDRAQAVFWVGPDLETFLVKPLEALAGDARVVALGHAAGVERLPARAGGAWERRGQDLREHDETDAAHEDPHVWLDPRNAATMVDAIVAVLGTADPDNAARYAGNGRDLRAHLAALEADIAARLAPARDRPYVVFHDAYRYFEARFGTAAVGSVTVSPERPPGARRIAELRERIAGLGALCILAEPQFEPALVESIAAATGARRGTLDPLGVELEPGPEAYFALLDALADSLLACLEPAS